MPKYRRVYLPRRPVFVTIVTQNRTPWIVDNAEQILCSMRWVKDKHPFQHLAHVLLPDHLHWIFKPLNNENFSNIVLAFKRDVSWRLKSVPDYAGWQKRFYDHVIRDEDDLCCHLDYVHFNPVKHGMVLDASEYAFSSFDEWRARGRYVDGWGCSEPENTLGMDLG